jgi:hypothetical protein
MPSILVHVSCTDPFGSAPSEAGGGGSKPEELTVIWTLQLAITITGTSRRQFMKPAGHLEGKKAQFR